MATPAFKSDPNLKPLSDSLRGSLDSQTGKISNALEKALGASGVHGEGFKKIKDKLQDIGEEMAQVVAGEISASENLSDALNLGILAALSEGAANEDIENALQENAAAEALKNQAANLNSNQAIDDFGKSALPDPEELAKQEALKDAIGENAVAANDNVEPSKEPAVPRDRMQAGMDRAKEKSEAAKQDALKPNALDNTKAANDNTESDKKPEPGAVDNRLPTANGEPNQNQAEPTPNTESQTNQTQPASVPPNPSQGPSSNETKKSEEENNKYNKPLEENQDTEPTTEPKKPEADKKTETPEEKEETEQAEKAEEESKKIDQALDGAGMPLVDTDEDNPMLPKKSDEEQAKEKEQQAENNGPDEGEGSPEGQNEQPAEQGTPQQGPERGRIMQGFNSLRNRNRLKEIDQETQQLQTDMDSNRKKINAINKKIEPEEKKIKKLERLNKILKIIVPILFVLSIVLSLFSLVLGWVLVLLPGLSTAASFAHKYLKKNRKKNEEEIKKLKGEIKGPLDERTAEYKKLKANTKELENLARERFRLKNQSLTGRNA